MSKTLIKYTVHAVGDEPRKHEHLYDGEIKTCDAADEWMVWGNDGNHIIKEHQDNSKYGIIENWWVDSVEYLSDCTLAIPKAIAMYEGAMKAKEKRIYKKLWHGKGLYWPSRLLKVLDKI